MAVNLGRTRQWAVRAGAVERAAVALSRRPRCNSGKCYQDGDGPVEVSTLPTAREVRTVLGHVEVGACLVFYKNTWGDERFPWQVRGAKDADGDREVLDEFATYREAVRCAKRGGT